MFLPIPADNQLGLIADLEDDPFVGHALISATCEPYHRYAMFLAPLTAALTTIQHCQFGHRCSAVINNIKDGREPADKARIDSVNWGASTESCWKGNGEESEGSEKAGGRACCRPAKTTARTASGSKGIITSGRRHVFQYSGPGSQGIISSGLRHVYRYSGPGTHRQLART